MYGRILFGAIAVATSLGTTEATAADVVDDSFDWTGFYLGAQAGYLSVSQSGGSWEGDDRDDDGPVKGGIYGGFAGYNSQHGNIVFGAEINAFYPDVDGTLLNDDGEAAEMDMNFFGTAVARVGWAHDNFLFYGVGGLAVADLDADFEGQSDSATHLGAVVGAGAEFMMTDTLSLKAEYNYVHLFSEDYDDAEGSNIKFGGHLAKLGIAYHF